MNWVRIQIETTAPGAEAVCGRLYSLGINGTEICDAEDLKEILSRGEKMHYLIGEELALPEDGKVLVRAYLRDDEGLYEMVRAIKAELSQMRAIENGADFGSLALSFLNVKESDWENNWKKYFRPIRVGEKIFIKPQWETLENPEGRTVFTVDPGMSFGTGSHATTRLCIEAIEKYLKEGDKMLDIGCGSGILSVIALLLGAESAAAVDIDPGAAKSARQNARLNDIAPERYTVLTGDILSDSSLAARLGKFNLIAANIVADVIIPLSEKIPALLANGGVFIASGIILPRLSDVICAAEQNALRAIETKEDGDWAAVAFKAAP